MRLRWPASAALLQLLVVYWGGFKFGLTALKLKGVCMVDAVLGLVQ